MVSSVRRNDTRKPFLSSFRHRRASECFHQSATRGPSAPSGDLASCRLTCWAVWSYRADSKQPGTTGPDHT